MQDQKKHCRWCGAEYYAKGPRNRDGFDKAACKQAHYRAYKAYVIWTSRLNARPAADKITQK